MTDSNHFQLILVNNMTVPLVYSPSGGTFSHWKIPFLIVNMHSDAECQTAERTALLLGICLPGLRANLDKGAGAWPWRELLAKALLKTLSGGSPRTGLLRRPSEESSSLPRSWFLSWGSHPEVLPEPRRSSVTVVPRRPAAPRDVPSFPAPEEQPAHVEGSVKGNKTNAEGNKELTDTCIVQESRS